ncbi:MAG: tetratricopeptide repeat protein, partial [Arenicellales bacterium WSBS_2016_MAG_OTU3]
MSQSGQNKTQQLLNKAVNDLQHGELAAAERGFKQVIKNHPNLSGVHYNLGYIYHARSDFKRAETSYKRAVELDAGNAGGWLNLGNVQLQQNHYKLAERSFKKALGLGLEQAGLYNSLATALDYQNKSEEAEALFKQAIAMRSPEAEGQAQGQAQIQAEAQRFARLNLAKLMHKQQRFRDSITLLEKFVSDAVDNIDGWLA